MSHPVRGRNNYTDLQAVFIFDWSSPSLIPDLSFIDRGLMKATPKCFLGNYVYIYCNIIINEISQPVPNSLSCKLSFDVHFMQIEF